MPDVVIGVGNEFRRDDGVGPAVVARLAATGLPGVALLVGQGEPSRLLDAWDGARLAVIVDAVVCRPAVPGRLHRCVGSVPTEDVAGGTHGLGVADAIELGGVLDRLPQRLVVLGVEAADLGYGTGLSPAVAASVATVADAVRAELAAARVQSLRRVR